jgi:hypothetical protein
MLQIFYNMINFREYKLRFVDRDFDVVTMCNFLSVFDFVECKIERYPVKIAIK